MTLIISFAVYAVAALSSGRNVLDAYPTSNCDVQGSCLLTSVTCTLLHHETLMLSCLHSLCKLAFLLAGIHEGCA